MVFRLLMEVERLEATFNYESATAPPLLLAAIEDVRFNLSVNPGTLVINASLGNMRAQDCVLPEARITRIPCRCDAGFLLARTEIPIGSTSLGGLTRTANEHYLRR